MIQIENEIKKCKKCGNLQKQTDTYIQYGNTPFIIIGESPAKDGWIVSKRAFYNKQGKLQASGRVLAKLLSILDYTIEDIYFTECCKCIIEDRKTLDKCSQNCKPILLKQLQNVNCDIIITMGKSPTQVLLDKKIGKFSKVVGQSFTVKIGDKEFKLIPVYHPSPLNPKGYTGNIPIFNTIKEMISKQHI